MLNKFEIIAEKIRQGIESGRYTEKLPSERAFAEIYKTTNVTTGKALNLLREKNLIIREKGKGSFVNPDYLKGAEVSFMLSAKDIYDTIIEAMKESRPTLKCRNAQGGSKLQRLRDSDISVQVSTFPASYERYFSPLPRDYIDEFKRKNTYYSQALEIHRGDSLYYGLPLMFSPFVLVYNKALLREVARRDRVDTLTHADLLDLESRLQKENGRFLFSSEMFRPSIVMSYIFPGPAEIGESNVTPTKTTAARISQGLKAMDALHRRGIEAGADFLNGDVLFSFMCRQGLVKLHEREAGFPWDICPLPIDVGGFRPVASESIFISNHSARQDLLLELASFFLSERVQNLVAERKYGIPMLKPSALDSLKNVGYRDDIFFTEIEKCAFKYDFLENNLIGTFKVLMNKYFDNEISFADFHDETLRLHKVNNDYKNNEAIAMEQPAA